MLLLPQVSYRMFHLPDTGFLNDPHKLDASW